MMQEQKIKSNSATKTSYGMKKILLTLSVFTLFLSFNNTFAEPITHKTFAPSSVVVTPATTTIAQASTSSSFAVAFIDIHNVRIISQKERDFSLSFDLYSNSGSQPQIKYGIQLIKIIDKTPVLVDEKVYDETFSLDEGRTITKTFNYAIPDALPAGTYSLFINVRNGSGLPLAYSSFGEIKIANIVANTIEIIPGSCVITNSNGQKIDILNSNIFLNSTSTLMADCKVLSNFATSVSVSPSFVTRKDSSFGNIIETPNESKEILIKGGTNEINFKLVKPENPGAYSLTFSLVSSDGKIKSNAVSFDYRIRGQAGNIENVVFDKTFYENGDNAKIQLFTTGLGTTSVDLLVLNKGGARCSASTTIGVSNISFVNLIIPITRECINPKVNITLSSNGKVLDSKEFQIITPKDKLPKSNTIKILLVIILLAVFVVGGTVIYRKKYLGPKVLFLAIIILVGFSFSETTKAMTFEDSVAIGGGCCGNYLLIETTMNANYNAKDEIIVGRNVHSISCDHDNCSGYSVIQGTGLPAVGLYNNGGGGSDKFHAADIAGIYYLKEFNSFKFWNNGSGGATETQYHDVYFYYGVSAGVLPVIATTTSYMGSTIASFYTQKNSVDDCTITKDGIDWRRFSNSSGAGWANLYLPWNMAHDSQGNIYVVDNNNNRITKFSPAGVELLHFGSAGSGDGQFASDISGVAVDYAGNIYVLDTNNYRVEKFSPTGVFISKFGSSGSGDAQFNYPLDLKIDSSGNVYVIDSYNNRVQKFSANGVYISQIGGYGSGDGQFNGPTGMTIDSKGNIYVADADNLRIEKFDNKGTYVSKYGGSGQFGSLSYLAVDSSDNIFVTDHYRNIVQKLSPSFALLDSFSSPNAVGIDIDSFDNIYVADYNLWVRKYFPKIKHPNPDSTTFDTGILDNTARFVLSCNVTANTGYINNWNGTASLSTSIYNIKTDLTVAVLTDKVSAATTTLNYASSTTVYWNSANADSCVLTKDGGSATTTTTSFTFNQSIGSSSPNIGTGIGQFNSPQDLTFVTSGAMYVLDNGNKRIQKFTLVGGEWKSSAAATYPTIGTAYELNNPSAITNDDVDLYIVDTGNHRIVVQDLASGSYTTSFGSSYLASPTGIVYANDGSDTLYIVDGNKLKRFTAGGVYKSTADYAISSGRSIATNKLGTYLYVTDGSNTVSKLKTNTDPTKPPTLEKSFTLPANIEGNASFFPAQIQVSSNNEVYVSDYVNQRIYKFDDNGNYEFNFGDFGLGAGQFNTPKGIAIDSTGSLYVADSGNNRVQEFSTQSSKFETGSLTKNTTYALSCTNGGANTKNILDIKVLQDPENLSILASSSNSLIIPYSGSTTISWTANDAELCKVSTSTVGGTLKDWQTSSSTYSNWIANISSQNARGLAFDVGGILYSGAWQNGQVNKFTSPTLIMGADGTTANRLRNPDGIAVDPWGIIFVAEATSTNNRLSTFKAASGGLNIASFDCIGFTAVECTNKIFSFNIPTGVAIDEYDFPYVLNSNNGKLDRFNYSKDYISSPAVSVGGSMVVIDNIGNIYTVSPTSGVYKYDPIAKTNTLIVSRSFNSPGGLDIDNYGNIYVAETGTNKILGFNQAGVKIDEFGSAGTSNGQFNSPFDVRFDAYNKLFVSDQLNNRIQEFKLLASSSAVTPALSTTTDYTLSCVGGGVTETDVVRVTVSPAPTANITVPSANIFVPKNTASTISWTSTDTSSCVLATSTVGGPLGTFSILKSGTSVSTGNLSTTTVFTLSCENSVGYTAPTDSVTMIVPTGDISSPSLCAINDPATRCATTLTWSTKGGMPNAEVWANTDNLQTTTGSSGTVSSGVIIPTTGAHLMLYMSPNDGNSGASIPDAKYLLDEVYVYGLDANLFATPKNVPYHDYSILSWDSSHAVSCTLTKNGSGTLIQANATSGSLFSTGALTSPSNVYLLTCSNGSVTATSSQTITVDGAPVATLNLNPLGNPTAVPYNGTTSVTWSSTNTTGGSCSIATSTVGGASVNWKTALTPNSSTAIASQKLSTTTVFVLTCKNSAGYEDTDTKTVNVTGLPTGSIKADNSNTTITVGYKHSTSISWSSTDTNSCNVSTSTLSGSYGSTWQTGTNNLGVAYVVSTTTIFKLQCYNSAGAASTPDTIQVTVLSLPDGYLDSVSCSNVTGWTCDADDFSKSLNVYLYRDNAYFTSILANITRTDLGTTTASTCGGYTAHGYSFVTPDILKDNISHSIDTYAINIGPTASNPKLNGSPKNIQCTSSGSISGTLCAIASGATECSSKITWGSTVSLNQGVEIWSSNGTKLYCGSLLSSNLNTNVDINPTKFTLYRYDGNCTDGVPSATDMIASTTVFGLTSFLNVAAPSVAYGKSTTFTFGSENAQSCTVTNLTTGQVLSNGLKLGSNISTGNIYADAQLHLDCVNGTIHSTDTEWVTVGLAPEVSFTPLSQSISYGSDAQITWNSTSTNSCTITRNKGTNPFSTGLTKGSQKATGLTESTTFVATCATNNGTPSTTASTQITVGIQPSSAKLTPDSNTVPYNGTTSIQFETSNVSGNCTIATSSSASGPFITWKSNVATTGVAVITDQLKSDTYFRATCPTLASGNINSPVVGITLSTGAPVVSILVGKKSSVTIPYGSATTTSWTTSPNAGMCTTTKNGVFFSKATSSVGVTSGTATGTITFVLSCLGPSGTASSSAIISVSGTYVPVTSNCSISPEPSIKDTLETWNVSINQPAANFDQWSIPFTSYVVDWSGTNITPVTKTVTNATNTMSLNKIYTSTGFKTIIATSTVMSGGVKYVSVPACRYTTNVQNSTGDTGGF